MYGVGLLVGFKFSNCVFFRLGFFFVLGFGLVFFVIRICFVFLVFFRSRRFVVFFWFWRF